MKGRKRHIVVDVLGLILVCHVTAANVADVKAAPAILVWVLELYDRLAKILVDQGYRGDLAERIEQVYGCPVEVIERQSEGFQVQPKRWIVERTWTWLENARGLSRDYERLPENQEGMIYIVMIRLMLRRLENNRRTWNKEA